MKKLCAFFCIIIVLSLNICASASVNDIFDGKQECLILGTVKDIGDKYITVTIDNTIDSKMPSLISQDILLDMFEYSYCAEHTPLSFNQPKIGDNIFASISKNDDNYKIDNGVYRVDSSEIKNCSMIAYQGMNGEECLNDAVKIAYFIRTNGKITNFSVEDDGKVYAISNDDKTLIYPLAGSICIKFVDENGKITEEFSDDIMPMAPQVQHKSHHRDIRYLIAIAIIAAGSIFGFAAFYLFYAKKRLGK